MMCTVHFGCDSSLVVHMCLKELAKFVTKQKFVSSRTTGGDETGDGLGHQWRARHVWVVATIRELHMLGAREPTEATLYSVSITVGVNAIGRCDQERWAANSSNVRLTQLIREAHSRWLPQPRV